MGAMKIRIDVDDTRLAALAVSGPSGAVKEQSSGLYAQTMAERGYREQRTQMLEQMGQQRWADAEKGSPAPGSRILPGVSGDPRSPSELLRGLRVRRASAAHNAADRGAVTNPSRLQRRQPAIARVGFTACSPGHRGRQPTRRLAVRETGLM